MQQSVVIRSFNHSVSQLASRWLHKYTIVYITLTCQKQQGKLKATKRERERMNSCKYEKDTINVLYFEYEFKICKFLVVSKNNNKYSC